VAFVETQGLDAMRCQHGGRKVTQVDHGAAAWMRVLIGRRKAFPNAFSAGLAVTEYAPRDPKAVSEMLSVVSALYRQQVANGYQSTTQRKAG
jgi:hypothetical protein